MDVPVRAALAAVPDLQAAAMVDGMVYLDRNELPWPPPPAVVQAALNATAAVNEYPSLVPGELVAKLARFHGVDPLQLAVGAGSATVLGQILRAVCARGEEVVFASPGFEAYPYLAWQAEARPAPVPLREHRHDLGAILDRARFGKARVVILCNPHNPTGTLLDVDSLEIFLDRVPSTVLVVIDEAYREFVTAPNAPEGMRLGADGRTGLGDRRNVAVLRTFSKAYGLAALRVGYCLASPSIASAVRRCAVPYSVTRAAQNAAIAALDTSKDLAAVWTSVTNERDLVREALRDLGLVVPRSHTNFVWIQLGADAERFRDHCADHKVMVRAYSGHGIRVSIGRPEHNEAFLAAAGSFVER